MFLPYENHTRLGARHRVAKVRLQFERMRLARAQEVFMPTCSNEGEICFVAHQHRTLYGANTSFKCWPSFWKDATISTQGRGFLPSGSNEGKICFVAHWHCTLCSTRHLVSDVGLHFERMRLFRLKRRVFCLLSHLRYLLFRHSTRHLVSNVGLHF